MPRGTTVTLGTVSMAAGSPAAVSVLPMGLGLPPPFRIKEKHHAPFDCSLRRPWRSAPLRLRRARSEPPPVQPRPRTRSQSRSITSPAIRAGRPGRVAASIGWSRSRRIGSTRRARVIGGRSAARRYRTVFDRYTGEYVQRPVQSCSTEY